ncbi:hypothetical protein B0H19DRAFT_1248298 [Mycena capillaripes]|nr:hypothetical protein B0H19DRAFT_1248298 [Mycena capillaripes]
MSLPTSQSNSLEEATEDGIWEVLVNFSLTVQAALLDTLRLGDSKLDESTIWRILEDSVPPLSLPFTEGIRFTESWTDPVTRFQLAEDRSAFTTDVIFAAAAAPLQERPLCVLHTKHLKETACRMITNSVLLTVIQVAQEIIYSDANLDAQLSEAHKRSGERWQPTMFLPNDARTVKS